jgi:hypothetical protein
VWARAAGLDYESRMAKKKWDGQNIDGLAKNMSENARQGLVDHGQENQQEIERDTKH